MDEITKGAFVQSLKRNNKEIKAARAEAIAEDLQLVYKRKVEDLELKLKNLRRNQENMLDLSPENTYSLKIANEFDANKWTEDHLELGVKIRETEIKLDIARKQYEYLFAGVQAVKTEEVA
jgi:hypothetical protein